MAKARLHISTADLSWRNFQSPEFGGKVPEGNTLIFGSTNVLLTQVERSSDLAVSAELQTCDTDTGL